MLVKTMMGVMPELDVAAMIGMMMGGRVCHRRLDHPLYDPARLPGAVDLPAL
jgi:hypothetical protein